MDAQQVPNLYFTHPAAATTLDALVSQALRVDSEDQLAIRAAWCEMYPAYAGCWDLAVSTKLLAMGDDETRRLEIRIKQKYEEKKAAQEADRRLADEKFAQSGAHAAVMLSGGDAVFEGADEESIPVWGDGEDVLMADGESLMLCGSPGVGKTTVAVQFLRGRLGLQGRALGYTVQPTKSKVLYLACDRPKQAMKALRRVFTKDDLAAMNQKLVIRKGPPPKDFAQNVECLLELCLEAGADTVIIDSLKDVALGLSKDDVSAGYNMARQMCLANGIQVLELHHQTKRSADGGAPNTLADVYGGTWLTAGAGSVVILDGKAGDVVVKFRHVKQPSNQVGPFDLLHDHETGVSSFADRIDLVTLCRSQAITALDAAKLVYDTEKPSKNEKEATRRKLDKLVSQGLLRAISGLSPNAPTTYAVMSLDVPAQSTRPDALFAE